MMNAYKLVVSSNAWSMYSVLQFSEGKNMINTKVVSVQACKAHERMEAYLHSFLVST